MKSKTRFTFIELLSLEYNRMHKEWGIDQHIIY